MRIENAHIKVPLESANVTSAYMSLTNLSDENILISAISCSNTHKVFFHDIQVNPDSGRISMNRIDILTINPRETIHFKPGGKHIMIMGLSDDLGMNDEITCIIDLQNGKSYPISFKIE